MQSIDGGTDVICRTWHNGEGPREFLMSRALYGADMAMNKAWGEISHRWSGLDRSGRPLTVTWLPDPKFGRATLWAYEISEGA